MLLNNLKWYVVCMVLCFSGAAWAQSYPYSSVCPKGPDGNPGGKISGGYWVPKKLDSNGNDIGSYWADRWNFAQCNCTSYVAHRLNLAGLKFSNSSFGVSRWGHAHNWDDAAEDAGIIVSTTPKKGSVAQWNVGEIGGSYGHVAYVDDVKLNTDNTVESITISQYNITPNAYSEKKDLKPTDSGYPPRFIQFTTVQSSPQVGIAWFPPVSDCRQASQWYLITNEGNASAAIGTATKEACPIACFFNPPQ